MAQSDDEAACSDSRSPAAHGPSAGERLYALSLDDYARGIAFLGIALYVLGLLTVNVYLFQIGASDFSLLRTRFILAGALAIFFLTLFAMWLVAFAVAITAMTQSRQDAGNSQWQARRIGSTVLVLLLIAGFVVTVVQLRASTPFTLRTSALAAIDANLEWLVATGVVLPLLVLVIGRSGHRSPAGQSPARPALSVTPLMLTFAFLLLLFLFVDFFAASIFPVVPEQFGGARPKLVTLYLKPAANALIGLRNATPTAVADPIEVRLLWEGEQGYLVQGLAAADSPYIQIARDQVAAVAYPGTAGP